MNRIERNRELGEQPIHRLLTEHGLKAHDLVAASTEHLTHKMVGRACRGRWLTPNVQHKVLNALNQCTGKAYGMRDLFTYPPYSSTSPVCPPTMEADL